MNTPIKDQLELVTTFKSIGGRMSYFNAAESTYSAETDERNKCRALFKEAGQALIDAGLNPADFTGDMLTSKSDYTK
jgi:hypothetical protein